MKWGSKKSSHSSFSSRNSVISRVFPVSWFSNFKQRGGGDSVDNLGKTKQRGEMDCRAPSSSLPARWKEGRFYSMDGDDGYWRLSFGEERVGGKRSTGGINPLWYDSDDEFQVPVSRFQSFGLKEMEVPRRVDNRSFNDMVLDVKKMKEKKIARENGAFKSRKASGHGEFSNLRRKAVNERKLSRRDVREKQAVRPEDVERDIFVIEEQDDKVQMKEDSWNSQLSDARKQHHISFPNLGLTPIEEDYVFEALSVEGTNSASDKVSVSEWRNLEDKKLKETNVKTENPRKSAHICRESRTRKGKQSNRVRVYSQQTDCKIRALEDMKKTRTKSKKKATKEQEAEGRNIFDRFAVVKSSFNPQRDFRDSMVEMISERGIRRAEELEELLACYLTLNSDKYHKLIIKVFRQVWFELNGMC